MAAILLPLRLIPLLEKSAQPQGRLGGLENRRAEFWAGGLPQVMSVLAKAPRFPTLRHASTRKRTQRQPVVSLAAARQRTPCGKH